MSLRGEGLASNEVVPGIHIELRVLSKSCDCIWMEELLERREDEVQAGVRSGCGAVTLKES